MAAPGRARDCSAVSREERRSRSPAAARGGLLWNSPAASDWARPASKTGHQDEEDPCLQVVIAAWAGKHGQLGVAFVDLDAPDRIMHVAEALDPTYGQLQVLKEQLLLLGNELRSGVCVLSAKSPTELVDMATKPLLPDGPSFPVNVLKPAEFEYVQCRQRLQALPVFQEEGTHGLHGDLRGRGAINMQNELFVRAAGGMVQFLERNRQHLGDLDSGSGVHIHSIRLFAFPQLLCVDSDTAAALQIFQEDQHPSMAAGAGRSKEGLSIYSLLEPLASSAGGRACLRRWLSQPLRDMSVLTERQAAIEELQRTCHGELLQSLQRELRNVRDISGLLGRVFGSYHYDNIHDWRALMVTQEHMSAALQMVQTNVLGTQLGFLHSAGELSSDLCVLNETLCRFIDLEASAVFGVVKISSGVDRKLDDVRAQYDSIDGYLTKIAGVEQQRLDSLGVDGRICESLAFHYFPQLGFHVSLPNPHAKAGYEPTEENLRELYSSIESPIEDWTYQFAGTGRLFYKCALACQLDAEVGDLVVQARELELELLLGVTERLKQFMPRLCRAGKLLAELDALVALALAAKELSWCKPKLSKDPSVLRIVQGRHPLVEVTALTHGRFVPNNTDLGSVSQGTPAHRVQVLTGANLAGKSVYLKQVGIIVYLAQIGSFVPAQEAEIGLCDFLFSRIHSKESATVGCSSFGIDLTQVCHALNNATCASLLLLDEFGKGTHAADGVALFGATIAHLCGLQDGPKAIATTHFTEIFRFGIVKETLTGLHLSSMRVLPPEEGHGEIAYLYQVVDGVADRSFGVECARLAGVEESVVARAAEILDALEKGEEVPPPNTAAAEAVEEAEARDERRSAMADVIIDRLCSLDPHDKQAVQSLLSFVWGQQAILSSATV